MIWNSLMYHVRPLGGNPKLHIRHERRHIHQSRLSLIHQQISPTQFGSSQMAFEYILRNTFVQNVVTF